MQTAEKGIVLCSFRCFATVLISLVPYSGLCVARTVWERGGTAGSREMKRRGAGNTFDPAWPVAAKADRPGAHVRQASPQGWLPTSLFNEVTTPSREEKDSI